MNIVRTLTNSVACLRGIGLTLLATGILCPLTAMSQVPPRFYWKTLSGANAVPLIVTSMSGNTNPFDAVAHRDARGQLRWHPRAGGVCAHLHAVRSLGHGRRSWCRWGDSRATSSALLAGRPSSRRAALATRLSSSTST